MNLEEIRSVYDACHDYLYDQAGDFPTWEQVKKAHAEKRIRIVDNQSEGSLEIVGENDCRLVFKVN